MVFHLLLSICLQFSLLLLQLLIFSVQIHRDADHDTQADDDKDDGQNYFTHDAHSYPLAQASTSDISPVLTRASAHDITSVLYTRTFSRTSGNTRNLP